MSSSASRFSTPHRVSGTQLHSSYHADDSEDDWDARVPANNLPPPRPAVNNNASTSPSVVQQRTASSTANANSMPKYPTFNENQLRKQCQDSIQQKSPMILVQRLLTDGYMPWEELSLLEKRLVDYNPRFFELTIDLPDYNGRRVKLLRKPYAEQLDVSGVKGGLRGALDEDLSWLPDEKLPFSLDPTSPFRECAIISFVPPRCFVMCDEEAAEDEEKVISISNGLRASYAKNPIDEVEIKPGAAVVGLRDDIFMRVVILEHDVRNAMKVRCICMDQSAIYSFERGDLFPLPDEFLPNSVPISIFLARFRGTHYVYKEKYQEVNDALCQPNKDEGIVKAVTCAIYGAAPDGLIIVDAAMPDNNWVSTVMIRSTIAAPMAGDPPVMFKAIQAEEAIKEQRARRPQVSLEEQVSAISKPKDDQMLTESYEGSLEEVANSVNSECDLPTIKEEEKMDDHLAKGQRIRKESICNRNDSSDAEVRSPVDEALKLARKHGEDRKALEEKEMQMHLLTASDVSEESEGQERHNSLWRPSDDVGSGSNLNAEEQVSNAASTYSEASEQEAKEEEFRFSTEWTSSKLARSTESEHVFVHKQNEKAGNHPPLLLRTSTLHGVNEAQENENDVDVANLQRALDAYIAIRRRSTTPSLLASAMDFSVISFIETTSRVLTGNDGVVVGADSLNTAVDSAYKNYLDHRNKM